MRRFSILLAIGILAALSVESKAAAPTLTAIRPYGVQRGTEVDVVFSGARLDDAQEVLLYYEGIQVTQFKVEKGRILAKLKIAADCRLGNHAARIRTASGVSNLRTFSVGPFKEIQEKEPNSDFASPQKIEMNVTVNGVVQSEDVDYYLIEAKKGQRISAEVEGIRLGNTFFDPYLAIMDMGRFELSAADDSALAWQDAVVSVIAPKDGTYVIQVRESAFGGSGACIYRLHVGHFPRPTAVLPSGGKPGETLNVRFLGDVKGEFTRQVTIPKNATSRFALEAKDSLGVAPSPLPFRVSELNNYLEAEPNNDAKTASPAVAPGALGGVISQPGDVDFFKFTAKKGQRFDVRCYARAIRSPLDSVMAIYRGNGSRLASNDDSRGPDSYIRFTAPADDEYKISVRDHLGKGGINYVYRIEVAPVKPSITMSLPEVRRYVATTVAVPQGNRMAVMVTASRANFGGALNVEVRDKPQGMSIEAAPIAANQSTVPVLFKAAAKAPLGGRLADLFGKHVDAKLGIAGHLSQVSWLVRGQGNRLVWGHTTDRMALVLTEEVPFKVDIVQPKAPLVRNGSMDLKIVATRKEGFKAAINVRMLYRPPGVGAVSSINIPAGKTEATLRLSANGGAQIRTWKIVVIAQATVGNGTIKISSDFADLNVSDSFFSFGFQTAAVEQGQETEVVVKVTNKIPFEGAAKVQLLGLPNESTTTPQEFKQDATELVFPIKTTMKSPPGRHRTLLCRVVLIQNGETVTHTLGTGELRIDRPLPPKPNAKPKPKIKAKPKPKQPMKRRLTRLEKLRLEREAAKKAAAESSEAEATKPEAKK